MNDTNFDVQGALKIPALLIKITAVLGAIGAIVGVLGLMGPTLSEQMGWGGVVDYAMAAVNLGICAFLFIGAGKLAAGENWTFSLATCIVAMIPCFACCLLGLPAGIWGVIVLMKPEVKEAFNG